MPEWFRKLVKFTETEVKTLDEAVDRQMAHDRMEAIHLAVNLLKQRIEKEKLRSDARPEGT